MTLESIYVVSQIVAAGVVVATLLAILAQAYQTNKIARADLTLQMWMQTGAMQYSLGDSPEKAEFFQRALTQVEPLTETERLRLTFILGIVFGTHEAAFNLRQRNLVEPGAYNRVEGSTRQYMRSHNIREAWRRIREWGFDPHFRELVDKIAADAARAP